MSEGFHQVKRKIVRNRYLYAIFLLPFGFYILFHYAPMYGVLMAFQDYHIVKGVWGSEWVGLHHFREFFSDSYFWKITRNTLLLNIYNLLWSFPAPIILALLLNELVSQKFKRFVQTISYLPHFISTVVLCGIVVNFLSSDGIVNQLNEMFGHSKVLYLMQAEWFRTIYISSGIWQGIGWGSIIFLAALIGVDPQQYEAALVDGASRWKQFVHVTLPGIMPTISIMFILAVGSIMTVSFEKIILLYNGSTYETADVIATYVYRRGLIDNDFSYATAVGLFQSVIGFFFLLAANLTAKKTSGDSLW